MGIDLDKWIEKVRKTEYLAEDELKALCDYVSHPAPIDRTYVFYLPKPEICSFVLLRT